jgi:methanogenic corrinoid protein MtbC1
MPQKQLSVKIIVGGAGVNAPKAAEIEADGYAEDAGEVVEFLKFFFRPRQVGE